MRRVLQAGLLAFALAAGLQNAAGGTQIAVSTPPPLLVGVRGDRTTFAGAAYATARAPAERAELLVLARPQSTAALNAAATDALVTALREALPGLAVTGEPGAYTEPGGLHVIDAVRSGGDVRVAVPGPLDDARLRGTVERARIALDRLDWRSVAGGARIADVALGLAGCDAFAGAAERDAAAQIDAMAGAFAADTRGTTTLADRTARPQGGWPDPLCGPNAHARRWSLQRSLSPTTAEAREQRVYAFARELKPVQLRTTNVPPSPGSEPYGGSGSWSPVRVRLPADVATLTVHGFAPARVQFTAAKYVWHGPNGLVTPDDRRRDFLAEAQRRLRALGIAGGDVVAQHDPVDGGSFIEVRTRELTPRDDVIAAIAGDRPADARQVRFLAYRESCAPSAGDVQRAIANAQARAAQLAAGLHLALDGTRPLAILLETPTTGACALGDTAPYDDRVVRSTGGVRPEPHDGQVAVAVTFTVRGNAAVPARPGDSAPVDDAAVRALLPPAVDHGGDTISGEARLFSSLAASDVLLRAQMSPDSEHAFRPLETSLPDLFLAKIGTSRAHAVVTRTPLIPQYGGNPDASTDAYEVVARVPARSAALRDLNRTALEVNRFGNVGVEVLPMRSDCVHEGIDVAERTVEAAAANALERARAAHKTAPRLVAIDLTGPVVMTGACRIGFDAAHVVDYRRADPQITLGAYARVVYR